MEKSINHEELDMTFSTRVKNTISKYKQNETPTLCDLLSAKKLRVQAISIQPKSKKDFVEGDVVYLQYTGKDEDNRNFFNIIYTVRSDALAYNIFITDDGLSYSSNEVIELKYTNGDFILERCAIALQSPKKNETTCDSFSTVDKRLFPLPIHPEAKIDVNDGDIFFLQYCGKESSGSHVFNIVKNSTNENLGYNIFIIKNDKIYKENEIVKLERVKDEFRLTRCPSSRERIPITVVAFVNVIVAVMAQYVGIQTAMVLGSHLSLGQLYCCKKILKLVTMRNADGNINKEKTLTCTLKLMGMSNSQILSLVEEESDFCEEPDSLFNKKEDSEDESSISSEDVARMTFSHLTPIHESQEELINSVFGENTKYDCFSLQEINNAKDNSDIPLYILETSEIVNNAMYQVKIIIDNLNAKLMNMQNGSELHKFITSYFSHFITSDLISDVIDSVKMIVSRMDAFTKKSLTKEHESFFIFSTKQIKPEGRNYFISAKAGNAEEFDKIPVGANFYNDKKEECIAIFADTTFYRQDDHPEPLKKFISGDIVETIIHEITHRHDVANSVDLMYLLPVNGKGNLPSLALALQQIEMFTSFETMYPKLSDYLRYNCILHNIPYNKPNLRKIFSSPALQWRIKLFNADFLTMYIRDIGRYALSRA